MTQPNGWQTVWITGASSGIGRELARQLDGHAVHIAASARSEGELKSLAGEVAAVAAYPLDVTDSGAVADSVDAIEAAAGPIDLAILNAGTWTPMESTELDINAMRRGVEVNYMGVVHALGALIPSMLRRKGGHIAIVASVAGYRGLPRSAAYGPTKAALINLSETLRAELSPHGITISLVNPGFVDTPATRKNPFPMPQLMSAEDAAKRIVSGLRNEAYEITFPRPFVSVMRTLRALPNPLYFWLIRNVVMRDRG